MDFPLRTEIEIDCPYWKLGYQTPSLFIGSCFSDNIGGLLLRYKFPVLLNPFGVLYNPASIANAIYMALDHVEISPNELVYHNNLWHSFSFHGAYSSPEKNKVIQTGNTTINNTHSFLKKADFLFVTFGTSWVFKYKETGSIVANCHKVPVNQFDRFKLSVGYIVYQWKELLSKLHEFNPGLKVVFTVSPIRHLKDGAHGNQLSKSTLLLAIDELIKATPVGQVVYFPAYEIVNDELRDYRFYASDMIHISETAINFIFTKFISSFFTSETRDCYQQVKSIIMAKEHRILNSDTESLTKFSQSMLERIDKLGKAYPYINFQEEVEHFQTLQNLI